MFQKKKVNKNVTKKIDFFHLARLITTLECNDFSEKPITNLPCIEPKIARKRFGQVLKMYQLGWRRIFPVVYKKKKKCQT